MQETYDAVVALAGFTTPDGTQLTHDTTARLDLAIRLMVDTRSPLLVVTGAYPLDVPSDKWQIPQADLMFKHAVAAGVSEEKIVADRTAIDTVGNALNTKTEILEPLELKRIALVTSKSHLPRSVRTFNHVLGPDYPRVDGFGSAEVSYDRIKRIHEAAGSMVLWTIMQNTDPGDDQAIREVLNDIIPKYQNVSEPVINKGKLTLWIMRAVLPAGVRKFQTSSL